MSENILFRPRIGLGPSLLRLVICLALVSIVSGIGASITAREIPTWYAGLIKPGFTPPNLVFPVVWTTLYALMALCLWRLWDRAPEGPARSLAIRLFFIQLVLNGLWTPVFFGLHQIAAGLVILLALVVAVILTLRAAFRADDLAGWLLVPYLPWICYASTLNAAILMLN